ncbi:hypothetical protein BCR33DRAFT_716116 [Rhizoclosmatium globosum]|uniref:Uncharacterized protein n=1 Tax=Rhizoclosmatium globosum TaxID=329046 RepID=A0A1Y2CH10_9FUNG|nr:hypothetical protein BCR33DRAFT_716116 [Rhizoclosmatium globosum]|eukprot:ORY46114.1 hypothetical protein BCR33DRAFT_716116 [Rhizoclosmatium globosum]
MAPGTSSSRLNQDAASITTILARIETQLQTESNQLQFMRRDVEELGRSVRTRLEAIESKLDHNKIQLDSLQTTQSAFGKAVTDLTIAVVGLKQHVDDSLHPEGMIVVKQEPNPKTSPITVDLGQITSVQAVMQTKLEQMQVDARVLFEFAQAEFGAVRKEVADVKEDVAKVLEKVVLERVTCVEHVPNVDKEVSATADVISKSPKPSKSKKRTAENADVVDEDPEDEVLEVLKTKPKGKKDSATPKVSKKSLATSAEKEVEDDVENTPELPKKPLVKKFKNLTAEIQSAFERPPWDKKSTSYTANNSSDYSSSRSTSFPKIQTKSVNSRTPQFPKQKNAYHSLIPFSGWAYELKYGDYIEAYYDKEGRWFLARAVYYTVTGTSTVFEVSREDGRRKIRPYTPEGAEERLGPIGPSQLDLRGDVDFPVLVDRECIREGNVFVLQK